MDSILIQNQTKLKLNKLLKKLKEDPKYEIKRPYDFISIVNWSTIKGNFIFNFFKFQSFFLNNFSTIYYILQYYVQNPN